MTASCGKIPVMAKTISTVAAGILSACFLARAWSAMAGGAAFTNVLNAADGAEKRGDIARAAAICDAARRLQTNDAANLCALSRHYCDLASLADSKAARQSLVARALDCAQKAALLVPTNATAHASIAVCYAKSCAFAGVKTKIEYSRLFKDEADKAIALDPKQDVAYYLLGRWNYGIASVGFLSRTYVKIVYGGLPRASFQDAAANFKKACELAPKRILYHAGLAMAYEALGEKKAELGELKICRSLKPSDPEDIQAQREAERMALQRSH